MQLPSLSTKHLKRARVIKCLALTSLLERAAVVKDKLLARVVSGPFGAALLLAGISGHMPHRCCKVAATECVQLPVSRLKRPLHAPEIDVHDQRLPTEILEGEAAACGEFHGGEAPAFSVRPILSDVRWDA